ncbi:flagellar biosynthesis protein FliO [Verminephrobacter aporrectodeae subsp. tuberculatae]|uniref:FliO/MopB family protein n=1 Tax=Verminephrobacter aporrectodeae TaxID=1110389 RepID=UPI002244E838|nr:flagellar biosynthetic protein FliO [Verminephrobacter aporrectodeae]MCW8164581.1 flagellar biosynthesis protein FliO [Verminephrobacter aporrectodeae subsp. tuberculatae]MCW8169262.1 flagellar biosynthesis protein FliO [Verminephrobacter aporrectodeae subsp. tuberculatae]MCW8207115.1 flagellar biosynthesis protein FliO [Verminephrobacter aporrectodeae subsp. tuberculatae]
MTRFLVTALLFVGAMALLPWLVRRLRQRHAAGGSAAGAAARVLSAVAVGPQQRVVTLEVGPEHARTWLVLGVTAQQLSCLHVLPASPVVAADAPSAAAAPAPFAKALAAASGAPPADG